MKNVDRQTLDVEARLRESTGNVLIDISLVAVKTKVTYPTAGAATCTVHGRAQPAQVTTSGQPFGLTGLHWATGA